MSSEQPSEMQAVSLEIKSGEDQPPPESHSQGSKPPKKQRKARNQTTSGGPRKMSRLERMAQDLDYVERDPKTINKTCQVLFEDVIGEPQGAHSDDRVWVTVYKAYFAGKICCDAITQYLCAVPITFIWGCTFSLLAFCQIYCVTPFLRAFNMCFLCIAKMWATLVHCYCVPYSETIALVFSKIFVTTIQATQGYKDRDVGTFNMMERA